MRKIVLLFVVIIVTILSLSSSVFAGQDYTGHWAEHEINWCLENGAIDKDSSGLFNPERTLTRREALELVYQLLAYQTGPGKDTKDKEVVVKDVIIDDPYYLAVRWWQRNNFGYEITQNGYFYPEKEASRAFFASILYYASKDSAAYHGYKNFYFDEKDFKSSFIDLIGVDEKEQVAINAAAGVFIGRRKDGYFWPNAPLKKGVAAQMLFGIALNQVAWPRWDSNQFGDFGYVNNQIFLKEIEVLAKAEKISFSFKIEGEAEAKSKTGPKQYRIRLGNGTEISYTTDENSCTGLLFWVRGQKKAITKPKLSEVKYNIKNFR